MHPIIADIQKGNLQRVPEVKTGFTIEVSQKVTEGAKDRIQKFKGLVIKISHGAGVEKTFTVRKIVEGIGVEKVFPFHSPNITKIHVVKKAKVRRQKLYYMRERFGKSARLSEKHVTDDERAAEEAKMEALYAEAVKAEAKRQADEVKDEVDETRAEEIAEETAEVSEVPKEKVITEEGSATEPSADDEPAEEEKETDEAPVEEEAKKDTEKEEGAE